MTVLQELDRYYDRMAARGDAALPGWSNEPIGIVLELGEDGALLAVNTWLDERGKPKIERVPKWFGRSGKGSTPFFLWDNIAYVLGLGTKDPGKTARDHASFRNLHCKELKDETDAGLRALVRFLESWSPTSGPPLGLTEKHFAFNIGFKLRGETRLLTKHAPVEAYVARLSGEAEVGPDGFCLVRGARLPMVRLHPKIKGVDNAASAEVPLVSFNIDAFTSYGKEQGFNAPTSALAASRYGAALNALLARGGGNRLRIADASVAFWADASALDAAYAEQMARSAENLFFDIFDDTPAPPAAEDAGQAELVRRELAKVGAGRAEADIDPRVLDGVRFHVLGLSPNAARLSVRFWVSDDFNRFRAAADRHAEAVRIEPSPWRDRPPAIGRLLRMSTALQEKTENIPNALAGEVLRAVLTGAPYPRTWLAAAIIRLRAGDDPRRGWHAAAIKACLTCIQIEETPPVSLDPDNPNQAYQLGRLFAVLEAAQREALGRINASIADRYYGSASATPARVFSTLMRGARAHISAALKLERGRWIERRLEEIIGRLDGEFPTTLRLEDQGRFAIGYYHERAHRPAKADTADPSETDDTKESE